MEVWFIDRGRVNLSREGAHVQGACFCLGRVFSLQEGALVLGGWNGRVFDGKCWWVLTESPSADRNGIPRHIHPPATRTPSGDEI